MSSPCVWWCNLKQQENLKTIWNLGQIVDICENHDLPGNLLGRFLEINYMQNFTTLNRHCYAKYMYLAQPLGAGLLQSCSASRAVNRRGSLSVSMSVSVLYMSVSLCACACARACACVCVFARAHACVRVCMGVWRCTCVYVCACVCVSVCACACMCGNQG